MEMSNEEIIDRMQNVIDRYKACTDDLLAKIDELTKFAKRLEKAAEHKADVTLFDVEYVCHDKLTNKIGEITDEVSELMKKHPYTFDVHNVPSALRTVGRYIDELIAERDKWEATAKQAMESYNIARRDRDAWFERYMHHGQQDKDGTCPDDDGTCPIDNEPCPIAEEDNSEKLCTFDVYEDSKLYSSTDIPKPGWKNNTNHAELNTCRIAEITTYGLGSQLDPCRRFKLSCGHGFMLDGLGPIVACPVCGKKVV